MTERITCRACRDGVSFPVPITMAFQPIADLRRGTIFAYEALLRGVDGSGAGAILAKVTEENRYAFDQRCRVTAIEWATRLDLASSDAFLSINFLPNAVYNPDACIRLTLETARRTGFPVDRIMFEFTESERIDTAHLLDILTTYRELGFMTAIDDFGAGFAGLDLLSRFQPDVVKLDMELIRGIDRNPVKRAIVHHMAGLFRELDALVVCEGVETAEECAALRDLGIDLVQGYLLARPAVEALPQPSWPATRGSAAA